MFCSKCGARNEEHSKFCYQCGSRLEEAISVMGQTQGPAEYTYNQPQVPISQDNYNQQQVPINQDNYNQQQAPDRKNTYYQQQVPVSQNNNNQPQPQIPVSQNQPQGSQYGQPQGAIYQQPYPPYQQLPPYGQAASQERRPVKSKKPLFLTLAGVAAVAIVILCVTFLFPSGADKALDNILRAAKGTAEAGSVEFTVDMVNYYSGKSREKISGVMIYDLKKGKIEYDVKNNNSRQILYDGTMYDIENGEVWWSHDYSDELDEVLEYYDEYKEGMNGLSKLDWEEVIDEAGLSRYVDTDKVAKCLKQFEKNLNSKAYLKRVCNEFSVEKTGQGTKYTFDVDVPKLMESLIDTFEPVIEIDVDMIKDRIIDEVDVFEKLLIEITIKNNKLVEIHAEVSTEDRYGDTEKNEVTITLKNYGKVSLDEDEIEDLIDHKNYWD